MRILFALLTVALIPAERHWQDTAKLDLDRLQGTWVLIQAERVNRTERDSMVGDRAVISGNEYRRYPGADPNVVFRRFKLLPETTPRAIDLIANEHGQEFLFKGIVEIDGDTFRFCFALNGDERPKEFRIGSGSTANSISTYRIIQRSK